MADKPKDKIKTKQKMVGGGQKMEESDRTELPLDKSKEDVPVKAVTEKNTYQLGPTKPFPVSDATNILMEVLNSSLKEEKYELHRAQQLSLSLSSVIKERVKALGIPRYKLVVLVAIGENLGQEIQMKSGFLWDATCDTFATYSFKNSSLFATATVYAVYFE